MALSPVKAAAIPRLAKPSRADDFLKVQRPTAGAHDNDTDPAKVVSDSTFAELYGLPFNPMDRKYDAAGTGAADDSELMQAVLDDIDANGGGILYLPRGKTFKCANLDAPDVPLRIRGGGTFKLLEDAPDHLLTLPAASEDVSIKGVRFDGNKSAQTTHRALIVAPNAQRLRVRACAFVDGSWTGVIMLDGFDIDIAWCQFTGFDKVGENSIAPVLGYAIDGNDLVDVRVRFNLFDQRECTDDDPRNAWLGWSVSGTGQVIRPLYEGNRCFLPRRRTNGGLNLEAWGDVVSPRAHGNFCDGGWMGISFNSAKGGSMEANATFHCRLGLEAADSERLVIRGNDIDGNFAPESTGISIDNSHVEGDENLAESNTIRRVMRHAVHSPGTGQQGQVRIAANRIRMEAVTGTATAGGADTITLPAGALPEDFDPTGAQIKITAGTSSGDLRMIEGWDAETRVATVDSNWSSATDNTSAFAIYSAWGIVVVDRSDAPQVDANSIIGSGFEESAVAMINVSDSLTAKNYVSGLRTNGNAYILTADDATIASNKVFDNTLRGNGRGINLTNAINGGAMSLGEARDNDGWAPYNVLNAHVARVSEGGSLVWLRGLITGSPEGAIPGTLGSELTDHNNGVKYFKAAGGNGDTGWATVDVTDI